MEKRDKNRRENRRQLSNRREVRKSSEWLLLGPRSWNSALKKTFLYKPVEPVEFKGSVVCVSLTDNAFVFLKVALCSSAVLREVAGRKGGGFTAAASLVSLAWALASYQKALRDSRDDKKPISYMAVVIQFCWHFFTIAARVITFALFASVFQLYFGIFIVLHWCIMTFWIVHCETEFCITKWEEIVFDMVVGIIYIFSWFNVKEGRTRCRLSVYYLVVLLENAALSALWYLYKAPQIADAFAVPALCVVFSSFLTGVVFMLMYYAFFHPNGPRFGQSPSCACEDPAAAFALPPEGAASTLRSASNHRSVASDREQKLAERDGCVPVFQVRPTAPSAPSPRPPRLEASVIRIDLFRNRYPAWERHVLDRSLRKAILAFECSPSPPRLQYKDEALVQERLEYETTL
ncbi:XK-related protein 4 [Carlito syrichta]|uniref:XK-related protein n=1 Tax=Carlito syrichta TaxID=1868482 RepID=A0A3Q0EAL2_CARSF|nr:XK-related protein 4 [Carlito syrichta]